jgi:thiol-disulfide isomerase/thioredoxin
MKNLICITLFSLLTTAHSQFNKEVTLEDGRKFLIGKMTLEGFKSEPYNVWFKQGYTSYQVDQTFVNLFKKNLSNYHLKLFLGTWCSDSKRQVPRIIKILEAAKFSMEQLEIVALDGRKEFYKKSPTGEEQGLNIIKVPTLIFLKNDKEVNRIVERPIESLEEDINAILNHKNYMPNYAHLKRTR